MSFKYHFPHSAYKGIFLFLDSNHMISFKALLRHPYAIYYFEQIFMEALYHYGNIYRTLVGLVKNCQNIGHPTKYKQQGLIFKWNTDLVS